MLYTLKSEDLALSLPLSPPPPSRRSQSHPHRRPSRSPTTCACMTVTSSRSRHRRRCWPFEWQDFALYYNSDVKSSHATGGWSSNEQTYISVSFALFPFLIFTDTNMNHHCQPNYNIFFLIKLDMCRTYNYELTNIETCLQ